MIEDVCREYSYRFLNITKWEEIEDTEDLQRLVGTTKAVILNNYALEDASIAILVWNYKPVYFLSILYEEVR